MGAHITMIQKLNDKVPAFLLSPEYRIWRHLLLQVMVFCISINVFWDTPEEFIFTKERVYTCLGYACIINGLIYVNAYLLLPRLLLQNKTYRYVFSVLLLMIVGLGALGMLMSFAEDVAQLVVISPVIQFISTLSSFFSIGLMIAGSSALVLFKSWLLSAQRVSELQSVTLQSELDYLKNQINPHFLFNMLNNANILADEDAETASVILSRLEEMLRYQMDDSRQDKVKLSADIHFLTQYLELEKTRRDDFRYQIQQSGITEEIEIPPLLFITFVENAVKHNEDSEQASYVNILFELKENKLRFTSHNSKPQNPIKKESGGLGLNNIRRRLELLYPHRYTLQLSEKEREFLVELEILI